jgi:hypothetical protein
VSDAPLQERLAGAKDREEVLRILGRRRIFTYALGSFALGLGAAGCGIYLIISVATGARSGWTLLALPVFLLIVGFSAPFAYAGFYTVATGRRWSGGDVMEKVFGRLNNTYVWPRRRRRR